MWGFQCYVFFAVCAFVLEIKAADRLHVGCRKSIMMASQPCDGTIVNKSTPWVHSKLNHNVKFFFSANVRLFIE